MKKFLASNVLLIGVLMIVIGYLMTYLTFDIVFNDKIYQRHLSEIYDKKYSEYKDLDIDLSEFQDELNQFEESTAETVYDLESFYIDSLFVLIPLLGLSLGFSGVFLVLILFHKKLHKVRYPDILKTSLFSYSIFYLPDVVSAIYFLIFKREYELKDIKNFDNYFFISEFFSEASTPNWLWEILSETGFHYFLFPLLVAMLLKSIYKQFNLELLTAYSYLTYLVVFIFYNTIFWYLFDLI